MTPEERIDAARERLIALAPLLYRTLDAARALPGDGDRGPLVQLLEVIAEQGALVEEDTARLYDSWFIETCDDWVVPYIGALLGTPRLPGGLAAGQRRFVANTLAYRRRKGTARVLEQLAADVTGWSALATEAFHRLALDQSLLLVRASTGDTADLRDPTRAEAAGGPFDDFAHTIDTRRPGVEGGRWSVPSIPLFAWRLGSWAMVGIETVPDPASPWLFHADPRRQARPWHNRAPVDSAIDQLAREPDLPVLLRRRPLADELRARRLGSGGTAPLPADWFPPADGDRGPAFAIAVRPAPGAPWEALAPEALRVCHLADTSTRFAAAIPARDGGGTARMLVDPVLGRLAVPEGVPVPDTVRLDHWLGFAAPIGAGPFDRNDRIAATLASWLPTGARPDWQAGVRKDRPTAAADNLFGTLAEAIAAWAALPPAPRVGLIVIEDSAVHVLAADLAIPLRPGERLLIAAASWKSDLSLPLAERFGRFDASALRPHIVGAITVAASGDDSAALVFDGLSHEGLLTVAAGRLGTLTLANCTLDAGTALQVKNNPELAVLLEGCLAGAVRLADIVPTLAIRASVIHGADPVAIRAPGAALAIDDSSVFGTVAKVRTLEASNTLFTGPVAVDRLQEGCARFCFAPTGSRMPRRYRCQPETAVAAGAELARVAPQMLSLDRASPWYAQLHPLAHPALRRGGDDGGEIGAFRQPSSALLEANIQAATAGDIRLGMAAGLFLVT